MENLIKITILIFIFKGLIIGYEFSLFKFFKFGKKYLDEYNKWLSKKP